MQLCSVSNARNMFVIYLHKVEVWKIGARLSAVKHAGVNPKPEGTNIYMVYCNV